MPIKNLRFAQLPAPTRDLLESARSASTNSYSPYSGFLVGAALRVESGAIYQGTVLENASYGLTVCAEAAALATANTANAGHVTMIAIVGGKAGREREDPVTPCGRCRQLLLEAAYLRGRDVEVYCTNLDLSEIWLATAEELLPLSFGPMNLGR